MEKLNSILPHKVTLLRKSELVELVSQPSTLQPVLVLSLKRERSQLSSPQVERVLRSTHQRERLRNSTVRDIFLKNQSLVTSHSLSAGKPIRKVTFNSMSLPETSTQTALLLVKLSSLKLITSLKSVNLTQIKFIVQVSLLTESSKVLENKKELKN